MAKIEEKNNKKVYIVHGVDTEGPLYESLEATFERIAAIFDIHDIQPTEENLKKLQNKEIDLQGKEEAVSKTLAPHLLAYNDSWEKIDTMLDRCTAESFRKKYPDSNGNGWVYNWHCVDHVGYDKNPRKRKIGIHTIFDHYTEALKKRYAPHDAIHWHFHPMSPYKEAHKSATSYTNSPHLYEIICRRIIERKWFPLVHRAGFHSERPDSHWFLEQWIPFDISNLSYDADDTTRDQNDLVAGRFGDWRRAPKDWSIYHPSHDDYQKPGNCRRWIGRILNLETRFANITETEIEKAFKRASMGNQTLLGITNHDFRDIASEVDTFRKMLVTVAQKFPEVSFVYSEAKDAFQKVLDLNTGRDANLELSTTIEKHDSSIVLHVRTLNGKVFGPQPFLAIHTKDDRYIHDNFDFGTDGKSWSYVFDQESIHADDVKTIGVAANDAFGNQYINVMHI